MQSDKNKHLWALGAGVVLLWFLHSGRTPQLLLLHCTEYAEWCFAHVTAEINNHSTHHRLGTLTAHGPNPEADEKCLWVK